MVSRFVIYSFLTFYFTPKRKFEQKLTVSCRSSWNLFNSIQKKFVSFSRKTMALQTKNEIKFGILYYVSQKKMEKRRIQYKYKTKLIRLCKHLRSFQAFEFLTFYFLIYVLVINIGKLFNARFK